MPRCPFTDPTREVQLSLSGDDWIVIRYELSVGQMRDLSRSLRRPGSSDPDYSAYPIARALAYLVRWSFIDQAGHPAPLTEGALEFMQPAVFSEITAAIDAHETAIEQEKKRSTVGAIASELILHSVA